MEDYSDQIGDRLKLARESAGLSVEDVWFKTRIPCSVILSLEAGDFSVFSSPTYAKSFLSQYSSFLSVDAGLWLDALQPASFISGEFVQPLWKEAEAPLHPRREEKVIEPETRAVALSGLSVLLASVAMLLLAFKGYEFLEKRYGGEPLSAGPTVPAQTIAGTAASPGSPPAQVIVNTEVAEPVAKLEERKGKEEILERYPRPTVVAEDH